MDPEQIIQELKDGFAKVNESKDRQFAELDKKMVEMHNQLQNLADRINQLNK